MQNFLASGDPRRDVKDPSTIPRCLTKKGSKKSSIRYRTGKYPGSVFNAKRQCQQACGENCVPYTVSKAPYNVKTTVYKEPNYGFFLNYFVSFIAKLIVVSEHLRHVTLSRSVATNYTCASSVGGYIVRPRQTGKLFLILSLYDDKL